MGGMVRATCPGKAGQVFNLRLLTSIVLSVLFIQPVISAEQYHPKVVNPLVEPWRWMHYPELKGKGIRCIEEDLNGYVWFGANAGVLMYDGHNWTWHNEEDGLDSSPAHQILAAKNDNLYVATTLGLYIYHASKWQPVFIVESGSTFEVSSMKELSDGSIMLTSNYGVMQCYAGAITRVYTFPGQQDNADSPYLDNAELIPLPLNTNPDQPVLNISDILEYSDHTIWMAVTLPNAGQILRFDPRDIRHGKIAAHTLFKSDGDLQFGDDQTMIKTHAGEIWVINRSFKTGIQIYRKNTWETVKLNQLFGTDEFTTDILQTSDHTIWIGSLGKLYTCKDGIWNMYRSSASRIPTNKIILAESSEQKIWIGGYKSQPYLFDYSPQRWQTLENLNFQCDLPQKAQSWYLHVSGRAVVDDGGSWISYGPGDGLIDAPVRIIATSDGMVWAAGSHAGVAATAFFKNGVWHKQLHPELSWGIDFRAVLEAFDGSLWFGGSVDFDPDKDQKGGVLQLKPGHPEKLEWVHHRYQENGMNQSNAYGIGQSKDSLIWIGGGSLLYYDGQGWSQSELSPLQDFVNIVRSSDDGLLLVGSRFYGLFVYDGVKWKTFNTDHGLQNNTIIDVYARSADDIWVATENHISRFDGMVWVNDVFPDPMQISFGAGNISCDYSGSIYINQSVREWNRRGFSGKTTVSPYARFFYTHRYVPDFHPPETTIDVFSERVAQEGNTLITWSGEDYFGFTPPDKLSFSYKLNDGEWTAFSNENHHTFLNLRDGAYILQVRARDLDFNIDPTPAQIQFHVRPPVWKQTWFILFIIAFLLLVGIYEFRLIRKSNKLEKLNESLHQINAKLKFKSKKIEQQNIEILHQQEQILKQKNEIEKSYDNLHTQNLQIRKQKTILEQMVTQVEALSRSKINFFTNISHELRTPLSLILGPAHQLQESSDTMSAERRSRLYKLIQRNAFKLLKLINQLLELRRIENSTLELKPGKYDLAIFLREITSLFENLATERNITFTCTSFEKSCQAIFDKDKVEKIVTNLLSNAFKHTPRGGAIHIALECATNKGERNGSTRYYKIIVTDTGTGISSERLQHIFDRYYSDEQDRNSSGIGLSYIKELVELHNGDIEVTSQKGEGTAFTVYIPELRTKDLLANASYPDIGTLRMSKSEVEHLYTLIEPDPADKDPEKSGPDLPTILVVENNEDMLDFLEDILSPGFNLVMARDGAEGLQIARNFTLDLIISDVMMPNMNGIEMCEKIKSNILTSHIPVILLTAKAMDRSKIEGYTIGADAYMTKPFNPKVLLSRVDNLLAQRQQLREKFTRDFALKPKEVILNSCDDELLTKVISIMEEHIDDSEFNVNKMCDMVALSHTHFIRKIKQLTGKKPVDLLKSFRLTRAKELLRQNKANISEIAYMVGYNLPNSFSRAFRKEFGESPKEFTDRVSSEETPELTG